MPTTTSLNYEFPLPGAATTDKRLGDIIAVKDALTAIDALLKLKASTSLSVNDKSIDYTLTALDFNNIVRHPKTDTTARTFTIPSNTAVPCPIGTIITFINVKDAGNITVTCSDTVNQANTNNTGARIIPTNCTACYTKVDTNEWQASGAGLL